MDKVNSPVGWWLRAISWVPDDGAVVQPGQTLSNQRMSASVAVSPPKHGIPGPRPPAAITAQHGSRGDADHVAVPRADQAPPIVSRPVNGHLMVTTGVSVRRLRLNMAAP